MSEPIVLIHRAGHRWSVALEWKPQDLWVGVFWRRGREMGRRTTDLWVCLVPMLPIHIGIVHGGGFR